MEKHLNILVIIFIMILRKIHNEMKVESTRAVNLTLVLSIILFKNLYFLEHSAHGIIKNILLTELLG